MLGRGRDQRQERNDSETIEASVLLTEAMQRLLDLLQDGGALHRPFQWAIVAVIAVAFLIVASSRRK